MMNEQQYYMPITPYYVAVDEAGGKKPTELAQQAAAQRRPVKRVENEDPAARLIRSDCGSSYLIVPTTTAGTRRAANRRQQGQQLYAEPHTPFADREDAQQRARRVLGR